MASFITCAYGQFCTLNTRFHTETLFYQILFVLDDMRTFKTTNVHEYVISPWWETSVVTDKPLAKLDVLRLDNLYSGLSFFSDEFHLNQTAFLFLKKATCLNLSVSAICPFLSKLLLFPNEIVLTIVIKAALMAT